MVTHHSSTITMKHQQQFETYEAHTHTHTHDTTPWHSRAAGCPFFSQENALVIAEKIAAQVTGNASRGIGGWLVAYIWLTFRGIMNHHY